MREGFIDLRHHADADSGGESFWPSFTDLMMVVLMIFMIASTILMLRNMHLVSQLRATIASEREARAQAQSASRTSATLEDRLAEAQQEISNLRIQLLRAGEQNQTVAKQLEDVRQQVQDLQSTNQSISDQFQQAQAENARLTSVNASLQGTVTDLRKNEQARTAELAQLRQQFSESEQNLATLQGTYDELNVKYEKLVKPARTTSGKFVVSVRYSKQHGKYTLEFKDSEDGDYHSLTRKQLDERLTKLKAEHPKKLYVKVVIPDDSGLSYVDAWTFTHNILSAYDYYYQD
jgi:chromosome segregation ATPase